jgi:plasmid stability protein
MTLRWPAALHDQIRWPAALHDQIRRSAERHDRSLAAEVRVAIREHLEREATRAGDAVGVAGDPRADLPRRRAGDRGEKNGETVRRCVLEHAHI